jgi:transcriptional regulator with XRE-family HTH domain
MPAERGPTVRRRRLAAELRRLRERAEMTLEQAAGQFEWSVAKLSRIETARVGINLADLRFLLKIYDVTDERVEDLVSLARRARMRGWWESYADTLPSDYASYIGLESEAAAIRCFDALTLNGLLQTTDYAREIIRASLMALSPPGEVERRVEVRTTRQRVLTRELNPTRLWSVIDEAVLRRYVGSSPTVMKAQCDHLLELSELPNVTVQVLTNGVGAHPATTGTFSILEFPEPQDPDVVYLETLTANIFVEDDAQAYRYALAFDHLRAMALGPDESRAFIAALSAERGG